MPAGTGAVTTYWCDIGTTGIRTSTSAAISAAYIPPQSTTTSHSTSPRSVRTPITRRPCGPSTVVDPHDPGAGARSAPRPPGRPAASAVHSRAGSIWPSVGVNAAPSTPSVVISGNSVARLVRRDQLQRQPGALRPAELAADLLQPLRRRGQLERSRLHPARRARRLQLAVQLDGVHVHPGQRRVGAQLADQPRGVERRAAGQLGPFDEQHVGLAPTGEVVGDARAAHPAADDHDPGTVRQLGHDGDLTIFRWPEASPTLAGWQRPRWSACSTRYRRPRATPARSRSCRAG